MSASSEKPEYVLVCKRYLRIFGLYYFKNDSTFRRCITNIWMFIIGFLFLLTAVQAFYQQMTREGFNLARDCPGILTFCKFLSKQKKYRLKQFSMFQS